MTNYTDADQKFFEQARKRSPVYPSADEQWRKLQRSREVIAARTLILLAIAFLLGAPFAEHKDFMTLAGLACFLGFAITCFVAGNRAYNEKRRDRG